MPEYGPLQRPGTVLQTGRHGIARMLRGKYVPELNTNAKTAVLHISPLPGIPVSARTNVSPHRVAPATLTISKNIAVSVARPSGQINIVKSKHAPTPAVKVLGCSKAGIATVYNLTVEDTHEFYANGILVHNCADSARYGLVGRRTLGGNQGYGIRTGQSIRMR